MQTRQGSPRSESHALLHPNSDLVEAQRVTDRSFHTSLFTPPATDNPPPPIAHGKVKIHIWAPQPPQGMFNRGGGLAQGLGGGGGGGILPLLGVGTAPAQPTPLPGGGGGLCATATARCGALLAEEAWAALLHFNVSPKLSLKKAVAEVVAKGLGKTGAPIAVWAEVVLDRQNKHWIYTRTMCVHANQGCAHPPGRGQRGVDLGDPPPGQGGVFAQRGHSANYYGDYPGNNPENHAPAESCTTNSKLKNSNI